MIPPIRKIEFQICISFSLYTIKVLKNRERTQKPPPSVSSMYAAIELYLPQNTPYPANFAQIRCTSTFQSKKGTFLPLYSLTT